MKHELKISPPYFEAVQSGEKTFEIRQDDRGFQKGDVVVLREWKEIITPGYFNDGYTGFQVMREITYVTSFQQKPGWVVFGMKEVGK